MHLWIKNTDGKRDAVLTMTLMGFMVVIIKVALSGVSLKLGGGVEYDFGSIDAGVVAAVLTPTLGAYVARRYTDSEKGGTNGK